MSLISAQQMQLPCRFVEIAVKQCRNGGIDCKVHGLQLVGRHLGTAMPLDDTAALARLLPPDFEHEHEDPVFRHANIVQQQQQQQQQLQQANYMYNSSTSVSANSATRVFVWGLNDKDQLGGPKGIKLT